VITRPVIVEMVGPDGPLQAEAELRYDPADPYAVTVAFLQGRGEVVWLFGRDLLIRGVSEPVGEGDVRVFPSLDADGHAVIALVLRAPTGQALVTARAEDVLGFLACTTRAVWPGTEGDHLSADDTIAAILT
jgi:hypothetical protein